jgi:hypothetical protein
MEVSDNDAVVFNFFMSDEAHFHLNKYINKQNFQCCADEYPKKLQEWFLHNHKITV